MKLYVLLCFIIHLHLILCEEQSTIVQITSGLIRGRVNAGIREFLGVPYALPPIGDYRWTRPQEHPAWPGILNTTSYDPRPFNLTVSEDCLYLNVYTPLVVTQSLPVMVWFYGGSFTSGSEGKATLYNGSDLVRGSKENVIVVTVNYRLGPFGFLALDALAKEDFNGSTGNYGFLDQRFSLQWVKQNIAAFGGDPNRVTIFGESAGAISVCLHMTSALSHGLFNAGLMESGFCGDVFDLSFAKAQGNNLSTTLGCEGMPPKDELDCLRSASALEVFTALKSAQWKPVIDGVQWRYQPLSYIINGEFERVPLLLGTNRNEYSYWFCPGYENITAQEYEEEVFKIYGQKLGYYLLQLYPAANYSSPVQALIDLGSDAAFKCPTRRLAMGVANQSLPVYLYSFNHPIGLATACQGVAHTFEIPFVYPTILHFLSNYTLTPEEETLSQEVITYWTDFAIMYTNGTSGSLSNWPQYTLQNDENIILDLTLSTQKGYRKVYCDFWDKINTY